MKKIALALLTFIVGMFFLACTNGSKETTIAKGGSKNIMLLADLALKSINFRGYDSLNDSSSHANKLWYRTVQDDKGLLEADSKYMSSCCCPCDSLFSESTSLVAMSFKPYSSSTCPCPTAISFEVASSTSSSGTLQVDNAAPLAPTDSIPNFKFFSLQSLTDGNHTLTIGGNFTGDGIRTYSLPIIVNQGKIYVRRN
jgi:hypothetical protein